MMKGFKIVNVVLLGLLLALVQVGYAQKTETASPVAVEMERVNINQADAETIALMLDGIGIRRAEAIVAWREQNGLFKSLDELIMVSGVGQATIQRNQKKIIFE
ncbi:MAG: helix-hairpin-helix domain-containing protein [Pseudomonadales bacterium]|nr:helix-hairpin-helix domain-containing protein [Pseudomonadales bacterium]